MADWHEPGHTIQEMLLAEPGSRVEAQTEDLMRIVFATATRLFLEDHGELEADHLALRYMGRLHQALVDYQMIVRDLR